MLLGTQRTKVYQQVSLRRDYLCVCVCGTGLVLSKQGSLQAYLKVCQDFLLEYS